MTFADLGQELAVPTEPKALVDLVLGGDWARAVAYFKAEYVDLICNSYRTVAWLYQVVNRPGFDGGSGYMTPTSSRSVFSAA
jgi:hypothetical protein